mmetsp:Transcript_21540/g.67603  ORF Transcript_21540/g.67603 Transcript_21540/m.67603 type:complete len:257 (-) Transcript_21540:99-869(-)
MAAPAPNSFARHRSAAAPQPYASSPPAAAASTTAFASSTAAVAASSSASYVSRCLKRSNVRPSSGSSESGGAPVRMRPAMSQPSDAAPNATTGNPSAVEPLDPTYALVAPACRFTAAKTAGYRAGTSDAFSRSASTWSSSSDGPSAFFVASASAAASATAASCAATVCSSSAKRDLRAASPSTFFTYSQRNLPMYSTASVGWSTIICVSAIFSGSPTVLFRYSASMVAQPPPRRSTLYSPFAGSPAVEFIFGLLHH